MDCGALICEATKRNSFKTVLMDKQGCLVKQPFSKTTFLSCLYGSERSENPETVRAHFLSCLYGSELPLRMSLTPSAFLSCLYGSEQQTRYSAPMPNFLSCLYGSELCGLI